MSEADRYRLSPVRDVRARDERVRRGDLASAVGEARASAAQLEAASRRVEDARRELATARASAHTLVEHGTTPHALALAERFIARKRHELAGQLEARLRVEAAHRGQLEAVDAARGRLAIARAEKEVIERHFEHWRTARARLAERRED